MTDRQVQSVFYLLLLNSIQVHFVCLGVVVVVCTGYSVTAESGYPVPLRPVWYGVKRLRVYCRAVQCTGVLHPPCSTVYGCVSPKQESPRSIGDPETKQFTRIFNLQTLLFIVDHLFVNKNLWSNTSVYVKLLTMLVHVNKRVKTCYFYWEQICKMFRAIFYVTVKYVINEGPIFVLKILLYPVNLKNMIWRPNWLTQ